MTTRPALTPQISAEDFQAYYWLKTELVAFCQENGLPTGGGKLEISQRIRQFLTDGAVLAPQQKRGTAVTMPQTLSRETAIGPHWRCSEPLRAFFKQEIGDHFHFNGLMRDFIKDGAGKTLQEAIDAWQADKSTPPQAKEIAPQFEYNQHIRDFFQANPEKTREEAIAAWKTKRAKRNQT